MARKERPQINTDRRVQHFIEVQIEYEQPYKPGLWRVRLPGTGDIMVIKADDYQKIVSREKVLA